MLPCWDNKKGVLKMVSAAACVVRAACAHGDVRNYIGTAIAPQSKSSSKKWREAIGVMSAYMIVYAKSDFGGRQEHMPHSFYSHT